MNTYFISLSLLFSADYISFKILNYTIRNLEISNKRLSSVLRTENLLFIL